jgi:hypothetical protein
MSDEEYRQRGEKGEKQEKEDEKGAEKQEKSWDEKWRRDPLNAAAWAVIIIWAGLVLLATNLDFFADSFLDAWPLFFAGAGVILLIEVVLRLLLPAYRQPVLGNIILACVFLGIGLGGLINWALIWAFLLIGIGVFVLFSGIFRRRE